MPQIFPNPISSNAFLTINTSGGLTGGGPVQLGGSITLTGATSSPTGNRMCYAVTPAPNGVIAQFTIVNASAPLPQYIDVFVAGVLQDPNSQYTVNGTTITLVTPPTGGQAVWVVFAIGDTRTFNILTGSGTSYALPSNNLVASYIDLYVNGVYQIPGVDYNLNYLSGAWGVVFTYTPSGTIAAVYDNTKYSSRDLYRLTPVTDGSTTLFLISGGVPTTLYVDVYNNRSFVSPLADYSLEVVSGVWKVNFGAAPTSGNLLSVIF
jgi:hypothetical protein